MGCAASNTAVVKVSDHVVPDVTNAEQKSTNLPSFLTSQKTTSNVNDRRIINILIACHTAQQAISEQLRAALVDQQFSCHLYNESTPHSLSARADAVRRCDVFVVMVSRLYQRASFCMEAINYAKDTHKPIIAILAEPGFQPYGALGALSASAVLLTTIYDKDFPTNAVSEVTSAIKKHVKPKSNIADIANPTQMDGDNPSVTFSADATTYTVLICTTDEGSAVAQLVYDSLTATQPSLAVENLSKSNTSCSVLNCTVFVAILTPQLERTSMCRAAFDQARRLGKPIIPVIAIKKWRPEGWLGLAIAGRTFFRIFDQESASKPFYDSNRITELRVGIETACQPAPSETEREKIEMQALRKQIDECKSKLQVWPPMRKPRGTGPMAARQPVRIQLQNPQAGPGFYHTHYSITRMSFHAPPAMIDDYGLPKRRNLDCMISYQWNKQGLVREIFEDFHMRNVFIWFDIWGSMQGNTSDSMAVGVECSKVLLVFLSQAYLESSNCQLEFRYAVQRGKAFVVLRTEPNIAMVPWIEDAIQGFPQYNVYSYSALEETINGVPLIDVVVQAVRTLAHVQSPDIIDDCSSELFELRSLLSDARDALSVETNQARYKTCTRCGKEFDDYSKEGCKKHGSFFMGGGCGLLEDQWVCCRQQTEDSPGCVPCDHTSEPRTFVLDPQYGTSTWKPA